MNDKKPAPAFSIDPAPTIEWPVTVSLPVDGGDVADYRFTGIFNRLSDAELDKLLGVEEPKKLKNPGEEGVELVCGELSEALHPVRMQEVLRENAELFPQLLVGWQGVKNSSGSDAPFSVESLRAQVTGPNGRFLSAALWRAVAEIRSGARTGN